MGEQRTLDMIYWNTTPGATYTITVPNQFGITPRDAEGLSLRFEVKNNVGLWERVSGVFTIDGVTPNWISFNMTNLQEIQPGDFPADGEYTYRAFLWDDAAGREVRVLSVGLMIFGAYDADREQYINSTNYEQYD